MVYIIQYLASSLSHLVLHRFFNPPLEKVLDALRSEGETQSFR
jgi:hypothetical protein